MRPVPVSACNPFIEVRPFPSRHPIPLTSTSFEIQIESGLVVVTTTRVFRNVEDRSIEATITFPVPVHATLFSLEARIGDRLLKARAKSKEAARETYEDGLDRGKTAVLHEELLRGVHMLSVGNIPPGTEITVTATWATILSFVDGRGRLRIPLTVGDIYGCSNLQDSDDLLHGGVMQMADLTVSCADATVELGGGGLKDGKATVRLDSPIDLTVTGVMARELLGRAADGKEVALRIDPCAPAEGHLDVAVLVDHSTSMKDRCGGSAGSKHHALLSGMRALLQHVQEADSVDLWEFNDKVAYIGACARGADPGQRLEALIGRLSGPSGGTEIGLALSEVIAGSAARDVLLITDGKSHALDVHALAQTGRRFAVVLVGEDSLEANVGHLAVLSGGDMFVSTGKDVAAFLAAALGFLRTQTSEPFRIRRKLQPVKLVRGGAIVSAAWRTPSAELVDSVIARAVAAVATSLALPGLKRDSAARLAEAEGLVTHLTSLVLVDEEGEAQVGVPAMRKIALPTPRASSLFHSEVRACMLTKVHAMPLPSRQALMDGPPIRPLFERVTGAARRLNGSPEMMSVIDWDASANQLIAGDLSSLPTAVAAWLRATAGRPSIVRFASCHTLDPLMLAIALLARRAATTHRTAGRVARAILGSDELDGIDELMVELELVPAPPKLSWLKRATGWLSMR